MPPARAAVNRHPASGRTWPLLVVSATAWVVLLAADRWPILPGLCGTGTHAWIDVPDRMVLMMRLTSPSQAMLSWTVMLAAMMAPLLGRPLALADSGRKAAGFIIAYVVLWIPAIAVTATASTAFTLAMPPPAGAMIALGIAIAWQGSAIKMRSLARCGRMSTTGGLAHGAEYGRACIGSCWAAMSLPYVVGSAHLPVMLLVTAFLLCERNYPGRLSDPRMMAVGMSISLGGLVLA